MVGFIKHLQYAVYEFIGQDVSITDRVKEMTDLYSSSITDMAKSIDDPDRCPLGALKSNRTGSIYHVTPIDIDQCYQDIKYRSAYWRSIDNTQPTLFLTAIAMSFVAVVLLIGFFTFFIPLAVTITAFAVPVILFGTMPCLFIPLSYRKEFVCQARILQFQEFAYNSIQRAEIGVDLKIRNDTFNFDELQKYANNHNIYFYDAHMPDELQKEYPHIMTLAEGLKRVHEMAVKERNDDIITMFKDTQQYNEDVKAFYIEIAEAMVQSCRENMPPIDRHSYPY